MKRVIFIIINDGYQYQDMHVSVFHPPIAVLMFILQLILQMKNKYLFYLSV